MENFYADLPLVENFRNAFDPENFHQVPDNWNVVITDVIGSTKAIEAGRYKDVNIAGALSAIALANAFAELDYPFVFGGDGVTFLLPDAWMETAREILADTAVQVRTLYHLDLRIGVVNVKKIREAGSRLLIAKFRVSEYYNQASFYGTGIDYAESLVKAKAPNNPHLVPVPAATTGKADFNGFTCRWQDIPSGKGVTISLIIKIRDHIAGAERNALYNRIFEKIQEIFGHEDDHHPLSEAGLSLTKGSKYLRNEAMATTRNAGGFRYYLKLARIRMETFLMRLFLKMKLPIKIFWYSLPKIKDYQIMSCDFRKYDGTLKMVLACDTRSEKVFSAYLEGLYKTGKIFYGIHASDRALMTCMLHEGSAREVHFIDTADGGYALAAKQLKEQMRG